MFEILKSPWQTTFVDLLRNTKKRVYLASPFIKLQTARIICENIGVGLDFRYINNFKLAHFHRGVSDLDALRILLSNQCRQKSVHNLHAKLFIFDDSAIVTSANLTPGGLKNNLEYGLLIRDALVEEIRRDFLGIYNSPEYPRITLGVIDKAAAILGSVPQEKRKTIKVKDRELFDEILNDENIEERFDGGVDSIISNVSAWERDVFSCLQRIDKDVFSLQEVYYFEKELSALHPRNLHVKDKIRQQLQLLRDAGLLEFVSPGIYKKLWE